MLIKKYKILSLLMVLAVFTVLMSGCSGSGVFNNYITISGKIVDYYDDSPIEDVKVTVNDKSTYTDSNGYYSLNDVKSGSIEWKAEKENYIVLIENIYSIGDTIVNRALKNAEEYSGSISGNVILINNSQTLNIKKNKPFNKTTYTDGKITATQKPIYAHTTEPEYVTGEILVKFSEKVEPTQISNKSMGTIQKLKFHNNTFKVKAPSGISTEKLLEQYRQMKGVKAVSHNHIGQLMSLPPNDDYFNNQWQYDNISMLGGWNISTGSSYVTVAVIDTGYLNHPDLNDNLDLSNDYDFVDDDNNAEDVDAYFNNTSDYRASHGTHVAGIIGAIGDNNTGIAGINWRVNLLPLRIFYIDSNGNQTFQESDLIDAIYYAIEHRVDIINLSLAFIDNGYEEYPLVEDALAEAYNAGITVVTAAGNDHEDYVYYPARSYYTIAVGASGPDNQLTSYSNYGEKLDIIAPGGDVSGDDYGDYILSTNSYYNDPVEEYLWMAGTSMAAPHVAGVAALLASQGIKGTDIVRTILGRTSIPNTDSRLGGIGILNAEAAMKSATKESQLEDAKVLATIKVGNTYYLASDITGVDYQGDYFIPHAKINESLTIIGWIDNDNDNYIDNGDYFGEYPSTLNLSNGEQERNINFNISYISSASSLSLDKKKVVFNPPPAELLN